MAGYYGFSMSNNAVRAYVCGEAPASKHAPVPTALVRQFCTRSSWHHTSKKYNETDFFCRNCVRVTFGLAINPDDAPACPECDADIAPDANAIRALRAAKPRTPLLPRAVEFAAPGAGEDIAAIDRFFCRVANYRTPAEREAARIEREREKARDAENRRVWLAEVAAQAARDQAFDASNPKIPGRKMRPNELAKRLTGKGFASRRTTPAWAIAAHAYINGEY